MLLLTDTQKSTLTIEPVTAKGRPALLDGVPEWSSSNPAVASIEPAVDGLSAVVVARGAGETQISVTADADLDEGETREISGVLDVQVKAGEAVSVGIAAGTPEEQ
jgi:hypothetical protein